MKLKSVEIKNFRRLEHTTIDFDSRDTLFVGANNSGKTSASTAFRCFLKNQKITFHDLALAQIEILKKYNPEDPETILPEIRMDCWFIFQADSVEFGRVFLLLDTISEDVNEVGIRCSMRVLDPEKLWLDYSMIHPEPKDGSERVTLDQFLSTGDNFKKYYSFVTVGLGQDGEEHSIDSLGADKLLSSLLRVDFVDAQRDMTDHEISRSKRLSTAFASFYKKNSEAPEIDEDASRVITESNERLTGHYETSFAPVMGLLNKLGTQGARDRLLSIFSDIKVEDALKENSMLMYIDPVSGHELPESYNGLGFKNLIYMAVQILGFHQEWIKTPNDRPLCHLIFIEEPEAHLHAQVQQTFISNIWSILSAASGENEPDSQLAITTHSSHIVNTADFSKIRYFRRCLQSECDPKKQKILNASEVLSLQNFQPEQLKVDDETEVSSDEVLRFLQRYLALAHCDLFFADAVVLVEGSVERILFPKIIEMAAPELLSKYITTLEVGGAYAHRFAGLMKFLHIPYIVITDLDSVVLQEGKKRASSCIATDPNAYTSNASIKYYLNGKKLISELDVTNAKELTGAEESYYVSYQKPVLVNIDGVDVKLHARTLEEVFIYENIEKIKSGDLLQNIEINKDTTQINKEIFDLIQNGSFKKTSFALDVLASDDWNVPTYISEALKWLDNRLSASDTEKNNDDE